MRGIVRKGVDYAGGILLEGSPNVFVNGASAVRVGDLVSGHGPSHPTNPMAEGSPNVFVNGISVCRLSDAASCGHVATGSSNVFAN